jgi:hypothetical protein
MELRERDKDGKRGKKFSDKIIGVARLPAELLADEGEESLDEVIGSEEE